MRELLEGHGRTDGVVRRFTGRSIAAAGAAVAVLALQSGPAVAAPAGSTSRASVATHSHPSPSSVRLCRTPSGRTVTYHSLKPPAACRLQKPHN